MLELLVESSELQLKAVVENKNAEPVQALAARTKLTLKLSFYALVPAPADRATGPRSNDSNEEPI